MFEERTIIYFDPFYFKNGNQAKPKYFVVLKNENNESIIASMPTRADSIPAKNEIDKGCLELPNINLNCFVFSKNCIVTECGKRFDFQTHIYGHQLDSYKVSFLNEVYPLENTDYVIWGRMPETMFQSLISCLRDSKSVKRRFRKLL